MLRLMDIQTMWIIVAAVSTPLAGVVGFAIQLRQVKKARLENDKLLLEIGRLKAEEARRSSRIILPTNREVARITRPDGPAVFRTDAPEGCRVEGPPRSLASVSVRRTVLAVAIVALLALSALLAWLFWFR